MIRTLHATGFHCPMTRGNNLPVLLQCTNHAGQEESVITKFRAGFRNDLRAPIRETVGTLVARKLGLLAPEPVLVIVPPDFHEIIFDYPDHKALAARSSGFNVGSIQLPPGSMVWQNTSRPSRISNETIEQIFVFDAFAQNTDREAHNPNLLFREDELYPIDHERCFAYLDGEWPWRSFLGQNTLQHHVLWPYLDRTNELFGSDLNYALGDLTEDWLSELSAGFPPEFLTNRNDLTQIIGYLRSVVRNRSDFLESLTAIIAR